MLFGSTVNILKVLVVKEGSGGPTEAQGEEKSAKIPHGALMFGLMCSNAGCNHLVCSYGPN